MIKKELLLLGLFFLFESIVFSQNLPNKSNIVAWFIGDSAVVSSGQVSMLPDESGHGNDAIQSTGANMPLQQSSSILSNHKVVVFDGIDDYLTTNAPFGNTFTLSIIAKQNQTGGYQHLMEPKGGGGTQFFYKGGSFAWSGVFVSPTYITTDFQLLTIVKKTDSVFLFIDGKKIIGNTYSSSFSGNGWVIGAYNGSVSEYLSGDIAEVVLYNSALNTNERAQVESYLDKKYAPQINLGADITIPYGYCAITLMADTSFSNYLWSTGSALTSATANKTGPYSVCVDDILSFRSCDTLMVSYPSYNSPPAFDTICSGGVYKWNSLLNKEGYSFLWQDGSTDSIYNITQAGKYYVKVTDTSSAKCFVNSDTVVIGINNFAKNISLGSDTTFCAGNSIYLKTGASLTKTYLWSDGSTGNSLVILDSGYYNVTVTDKMGCVGKDTIKVNIKGVAPTSKFNYVNIVACRGDSVRFNDLSVPNDANTIVNHLWIFGDADSSVLVNPAHLYKTPNDTGIINVKLHITTSAGCSQDTVIPLHIYPKPDVNFKEGLACSGQTLKFTDKTKLWGYSVQSYLWNFNDPSSLANDSSKLQSPAHDFSTAATYNVKLTVANDKGCSYDTVESVTVRQSPKASFTTSAVTCEKQKITFTDNSVWGTSPGSFNTIFGDGRNSGLNPTSNTYSSSGTYTVLHIVTDPNGCKDTLAEDITIHKKPIANFVIAGPLCLNNTIGFNDSSVVADAIINKWTWKLDAVVVASTQNTTSNFTTAGIHTADLIVASANGCLDTISKSFTMHTPPTSAFSYTPLFGAPPLLITFTNQSTGANAYSWDFGDSNTSTLVAPTHTYADSGFYIIKLKSIDVNGCSNSSTETIDVRDAHYDMSLIAIDANVDADNFLNVKINSFGNKSTRPLTSADFIVDVDGGEGFKESWTGNIAIHGSSSYTFQTSPRLSSLVEHNYICVTAKKPDGFPDEDPSDNEICIPLKSDQFILPEPSPNPATDQMTIPFIVPAADVVEISIYNKLGQKLNDTYTYPAAKGYNSITLYMNDLSAGVYTYLVTYKSVSAFKKFIKLAQQ